MKPCADENRRTDRTRARRPPASRAATAPAVRPRAGPGTGPDQERERRQHRRPDDRPGEGQAIGNTGSGSCRPNRRAGAANSTDADGAGQRRRTSQLTGLSVWNGQRAHGRAGVCVGAGLPAAGGGWFGWFQAGRRRGGGAVAVVGRMVARKAGRGQLAEVGEQQDLHEVDRSIVAVERDAPLAVEAADHRSHRQAAREHAAVARGQHPIALAQRVMAAQVGQLRLAPRRR